MGEGKDTDTPLPIVWDGHINTLWVILLTHSLVPGVICSGRMETPDPHRAYCSKEMNNLAHFGRGERPQVVGQGYFQHWQVGGVGSIISLFLIQIQQSSAPDR